MGQARYVVRWQRKDGFYDNSLPRWDGTSMIHRETAVKGRIRRSLTNYMGWDKHDTPWDGSEKMDSTMTHSLHGMGQARHVVRRE